MTEIIEHLKNYARKIRDDLRANPVTGGDGASVEPMLHDRFRELIEALLPVIFPGAAATLPRVSVEWTTTSIGRPDIAFARAGLARAFIELKAPEKSINPKRFKGHDKEQFERFSNLPTWALSNFHDITFYHRGDAGTETRVVPAASLDPETPDAKADRLIDAHDARDFLQILEALVMAQPVSPRTAKDMATHLAYAARFVKDVAYDLAVNLPDPTEDTVEEERRYNQNPLYAVREEFRQVLYERPTALGHADDESFDRLFAVAFAQTLAYGLLLAREEAGHDVDEHAHQHINEDGHPLLRATLRALMLDEVRRELGPALGVLIETVNAADPVLLTPREGHDPILYFYEDFLKVFDETLWKRFGVVYTPVSVVRYQVAAMQRALEALGTDGLLDARVQLLDPACGTGTYLIASAEAAGTMARERFGGAAAAGEVRSLTRRLFGLEIMVGPYAVAHYRLSRALKAIGAAPEGQRLNIFLADTLAPAEGETHVTNPLGFMGRPIVEERTQADRVKRETPIIAIFGNPPYRRLREGETYGLVGTWVSEQLWERYKEPVRNAGWGGELNTFPDLYIAFFAWSQWKLFWRENAPERGVLCFITNRSYLTGHPYAGLRQCLRQTFSRIDILDLRGDNRGARPAGIEVDENVFDIEVGVAIVMAWADGNNATEPARVRYADVWAHNAFTREEKMALLDRTAANPDTLTFVDVVRDELEDFRPRPFEGRNWASLENFFLDRTSGFQTKRDDFVIAPTSEILATRIQHFLRIGDIQEAKDLFGETRDRKIGNARRTTFDAGRIQQCIYRSFDRRWYYHHEAFVDFLRPKLHMCWNEGQNVLYTMPKGIGAGPAVLVHGLKPDYHAFRGSYGGYAFPLYDRRPGGDGYNLDLRLVQALSDRYGQAVTPEEIFSVIVALLSAPSYTRRFAADLEDASPHVPFPASVEVFLQAVAVGERIRQLQTFAIRPEQRFWTTRLEGDATGRTIAMPRLNRAFVEHGDGSGAIHLNADGTLRLEHVPERVWQFAVSGYQVVYRWLEARNGLSLDAVVDPESGETLQRQLLDLIARVHAYIEACDLAEPVLEAALTASFTTADLNLTPREQTLFG